MTHVPYPTELRTAAITLVAGLCLLAGCAQHRESRYEPRPLTPATAPDSNAAAIVGVGQHRRVTTSPDLYGRRDAMLAARPIETLGMSDQWQPPSTLDVSRSRRLNVPRNVDSFIYFERTSHETYQIEPRR
jgi:hypothetical protein